VQAQTDPDLGVTYNGPFLLHLAIEPAKIFRSNVESMAWTGRKNLNVHVAVVCANEKSPWN
jgi:hypothetical protein